MNEQERIDGVRQAMQSVRERCVVTQASKDFFQYLDNNLESAASALRQGFSDLAGLHLNEVESKLRPVKEHVDAAPGGTKDRNTVKGAAGVSSLPPKQPSPATGLP